MHKHIEPGALIYKCTWDIWRNGHANLHKLGKICIGRHKCKYDKINNTYVS